MAEDGDDVEEDYFASRGRGRSESFVNELEEEEVRLKERELFEKVEQSTKGGGDLSAKNSRRGYRPGGMSSYDSMEDFEPVVKTQLSQKTLEIVTNLEHTKFNKRTIPQSDVELFPQPVVDMSQEEAEEEIALEEEAKAAMTTSAATASKPVKETRKSGSGAGLKVGRLSLSGKSKAATATKGRSPSSTSSSDRGTSPGSSPASTSALPSATPGPTSEAASMNDNNQRTENDSRRSDAASPTQAADTSKKGPTQAGGDKQRTRTPKDSSSAIQASTTSKAQGLRAKAIAKASSSFRSMRRLNPYSKKSSSSLSSLEKPVPTPPATSGIEGEARNEGSSLALTLDGDTETAKTMQEDRSREHFDYHVKVLLLGDSAVGKTSLMMRFSDNEFTQNLMSTAGVDFKIRYLEDPVKTNGQRIKCQIWDTAGQERFHVITRTYYRGSHAIALVYDVCNEQSFKQISYWMNNIKSHAGPDVFVVIFGNKVDLPHRKVSHEQGRAVAEQYGCLFFETSAKDGTNVLEAFEALSMNAVARIDASKQQRAAAAAETRTHKRPSLTADSRSKQRPCSIL